MSKIVYVIHEKDYNYLDDKELLFTVENNKIC